MRIFSATATTLLFSLTTSTTLARPSPDQASSTAIKRETNASRFARGLPPLPPKSLYRPSPVSAAEKSRRSTVPPRTYVGRIEVRDNSDNHTIGYVRNWSNKYSAVNGINFGDPSQDLHVSFTVPQPGTVNGPFRIDITNPNFPGPDFLLGARTGSPPPILAIGSLSSVALGVVPESPLGAPPTAITGTADYGESGIWSFDPSTNQLFARYTNPDSSRPTTVIAYSSRENNLFFVGDISLWNGAQSGYSASAVRFYLANF